MSSKEQMSNDVHISFVAQVWNALGNNSHLVIEKQEPEDAVKSLSARDLLLLHELAKGVTTKEAAENLGMSTRTLRRRLHSICIQLNVETPIEAIALTERALSSQSKASEINLSLEEIELLSVVATGSTTDVASRKLEISASALRRKIRKICKKIGVETPVEAIVWAARRKII